MSSDIHALSGAYAVDALDDIERAQFERHLAECEACRAEVRSLREATALLAEAVQQEPPAGLRDRVLAGIDTVRPLPPLTSPASAPLTPVVSSDADALGTPASSEASGSRRTRRRFPALVAAASVAAVLGLGGVVASQPWKDETSQPPSAVDQVLAAPDAESWEQRMDDGAKVTLTRSEKLNRAVVTAEGMPELTDEQVYELWLQHDGRMVPAGVMDGESGTLLLEGDPSTAEAAGITIEPAGGSEEPTTEPIMTFPFEQV
ncbi:anti-sigma factor [Nocardioides lijunqiniae]|uniref:anti-sigma factor n=1 Tax=Nocardioides lijunqiniae TaxID=2760832 RepID=UPI0018778D62|nr:anti-sigma factor [Nocardioides lijunqiniae]